MSTTDATGEEGRFYVDGVRPCGLCDKPIKEDDAVVRRRDIGRAHEQCVRDWMDRGAMELKKHAPLEESASFLIAEVNALRKVKATSLAFFKRASAALGDSGKFMAGLISLVNEGKPLNVTALVEAQDPQADELTKEMALYQAALREHDDVFKKETS